MALTQEHLVTCGTGKDLKEAEARLGRQCTISYHPHLSARSYYTRVHVDNG